VARGFAVAPRWPIDGRIGKLRAMPPPRRVVASAPARANLLGNPSDQYGGAQISCSVPLRARVALYEAPALELAIGGEVRAITSAADLAPRGDLFDLARAVLRARPAGALPRARLALETEIPLQSGLAGSTALVVALVQALAAWRGGPLGLHALAEEARRIEAETMGVTCGFGDQYMAAFGGLAFLDFRDKTPRGDVAPQPYASVEPLAAHVPALPFVLAYTGVRHSSGAVHRPIRERWLAGERAVVAGYERVATLAREGKRALLEADWKRFGALMDENHAIQRGFGGSGESNERLIAAAKSAGALGAKLAGAGDGGTIVALVEDATRAAVEAALREARAEALYRPEPVPGVVIERG
jgi:galactokinase/mevalonate kinase-like predicted kinase